VHQEKARLEKAFGSSGQVEWYDLTKAEELGVAVSTDLGADAGADETGQFYLRLECRVLALPGSPLPKASQQISTVRAKAVLEQYGLGVKALAHWEEDAAAECAVALTALGTELALVRKAVAKIVEDDGARTFGKALGEPTLLRVLLEDDGARTFGKALGEPTLLRVLPFLEIE